MKKSGLTELTIAPSIGWIMATTIGNQIIVLSVIKTFDKCVISKTDVWAIRLDLQSKDKI